MNQKSLHNEDVQKLQLRIKELENRQEELLKKLRDNTSLHSKVLDALPINVFLEDREGRTVFANEQTCRLHGVNLEELVGKTVFDFLPEYIAKMDLEVWEKGSLITSETMGSFQGKEIFMYDGKTIIHLPESGEEFMLGFGIDITDLKKAEKKIAHMAYHDALTGLPNRWFISDYLEKYQSEEDHLKKMLGVLLLDLDQFKVINDSLGHHAGDLLLQSVAGRLRSAMDEEVIVSRFGGDEFILLIPNLLRPEDIFEIGEHILRVMEEPFSIYGENINISASIGISLFPFHGEDISSLIKNADLAMYYSKDKGRNCYSLFASSMKENAITRMDMELQLRRALENNEFILHYQPKLDLKTGKISGMEALIRWKNSDGQLLYPDSFIEIAEESGLIVPIGEWVLREACYQCNQWHSSGYPELSVSVNISPQQFQKQNLEGLISAILFETGLPPSALELELTEGTIMKEPEEAAIVLKNLKALGITISIDDFGTGFSSLSYLKKFPIDILKIDRSFIMNLEWDEANSSIASTVISLARNLKLKVVAEGVETLEQLNFLQLGDCDYGQGYYISKPIDIKESITEVMSNLLVI